jgi:hypothetical protein
MSGHVVLTYESTARGPSLLPSASQPRSMLVGRLRSSGDERVVFRPVDDSEVAAGSSGALASCTLAGHHELTKIAIRPIGKTDETFSSSKQMFLGLLTRLSPRPFNHVSIRALKADGVLANN